MSDACVVSIGGSPVTIEKGSLRIIKNLGERATATFNVIDLTATGDYVRGEAVSINDPDSNLVFAGFIDKPRRTRMVSGVVWSIVCMDNHYLADKRLVFASYTNQTLSSIVNDLWDLFLADEGITIGLVQTGPTIKSAIFNYVRASEALDALEELTGYAWRISDSKALYFTTRDTYSASWNLDGTTHKPLGPPRNRSPYLEEGNPLYRNRQIIRGGKGKTTEQVETFIGDGSIKSFTVGYPIAETPAVEVNSVSQTVGIKGIDTGKDCYWNKGEPTITFDTAPTNGHSVEITYYGQYPLIVSTVNNAEIAARKALEGGTGLVEEIATEGYHDTHEAMAESAKAKIDRYAQDAEKFVYETNEAGLEPGTVQDVTYSLFGFSAHEMLISSVEIEADGTFLLYKITCITGPAMGDWTKFFSSMITRADKTLKIGDDILLGLLSNSESTSLSDATGYHTDDFSSGIVNRWIALPPTQAEGCNVEHEQLDLSGAPTYDSHTTEAYLYDDSDAIYGFATWG